MLRLTTSGYKIAPPVIVIAQNKVHILVDVGNGRKEGFPDHLKFFRKRLLDSRQTRDKIARNEKRIARVFGEVFRKARAAEKFEVQVAYDIKFHFVLPKKNSSADTNFNSPLIYACSSL